MVARVNTDKCQGCGECSKICPVDAIEIKNQKAVISDSCVECGTCVTVCSQGALTL
jgi:electron transfer flavoprotein alpha subunit